MAPYRSPQTPAPDVHRTAVHFVARPAPRPLTAVVAEGAAAEALVRRLLALPDAARVALRGVAGGDVVLVEGPAESLPWVDGARYLGRCDDAPGLHLPCAQDPTVPAALLGRTLAARMAPDAGPFALWPRDDGGLAACSLADARPLHPALLAAWLGAR